MGMAERKNDLAPGRQGAKEMTVIRSEIRAIRAIRGQASCDPKFQASSAPGGGRRIVQGRNRAGSAIGSALKHALRLTSGLGWSLALPEHVRTQEGRASLPASRAVLKFQASSAPGGGRRIVQGRNGAGSATGS